MELIEAIPRARSFLAAARIAEAERIAASLANHRVVGVLGEGEVGKTETVGQALGLGDEVAVVRLDFDAVASDAHVGFLLARSVARAVVDPTDLSLLSAGALWPSRVERARLGLAELLGSLGLEEALRTWPSGSFPAAAGFEALESLAERQPVILWMDHLETPALTARHPVKTVDLLWRVREMVQRLGTVGAVLTARKAFERRLLGARAPFHQQGSWLTIDNPGPDAWRAVAERFGVWPGLAVELAHLTAGHPATMLHALIHVREAATRTRLQDPHGVLRALAVRDDGLAGRATQHARSLHRLGSQVLTQIANGERPYGALQRGASSPQEVRKVLERLRLAGLVRPGPRWGVVNPLLAIRLRGSVDLMPPPDDEADQSYE